MMALAVAFGGVTTPVGLAAGWCTVSVVCAPAPGVVCAPAPGAANRQTTTSNHRETTKPIILFIAAGCRVAVAMHKPGPRPIWAL
jgi:hypothetical protein